MDLYTFRMDLYPFRMGIGLQTFGQAADSIATREQVRQDALAALTTALDDLFYLWDHADQYPTHDGRVTKGLAYAAKDNA